jgi:hypothetical protein
VAVDPNTGIVYAANAFAGTVTSFGIGRGSVTHSAIISDPVQGTVLPGLVLNSDNHTLFVMVRSNSGDGWVRVLNEANLAPIANITFTTYPYGIFNPLYFAYDPGTNKVFVESTQGYIVVLSGSTYSLLAILACPVTKCVSRGITDISTLGVLVQPTNTSTLAYWEDSTLTATTISGAPSAASTAFAAYDPTAKQVWVDDFATHGYSEFLLYNLTNNSYVGALTGAGQQAPPLVTAMTFDPATGSVLVADEVNATEAWSYNATSGLVVGHTTGGALVAATPRVFVSLTVDPATDQVIGSGAYYNSTITFSLPRLGIVKQYSSFPTVEDLVGIDGGAGDYYVIGGEPSMLAALSLNTESVQWMDYLPPNIPPQPANRTAVDTSTGTIFIAEGDANRTIVEINAYTGQVSATWGLGPISGVPDAIAVDPPHNLLYVTTLGHVAAYNITSTLLSQTAPTPGVAGCALATNTSGWAFFVNCATPGTVESYDGVTNTLGPSWTDPALADPVGIAVAAQTNTVYVTAAGAKNVVVLPGNLSSISESLPLAPSVPMTASTDSALNLAFVSAWHNLSLAVLNTAGTPAFLSPAIVMPSPINHTAYYAATSVVYGAELVTGSTFTLTPVTVPSAPATPSLTVGNGTLTASWAAPFSGHAPIGNYTVQLGENATGPFGNTTLVQTTTCTFAGLTNGHQYYVIVSASNAAGVGPTSPAAGPATPVTIPYPPTSLSKQGETDSSIDVKWQPPANTGGSNITSYELRWTAAGSSMPGSQTAPGLTYNITGLTANTSYTIEVAAANGVGLGHYSQNISVTTLTTPTTNPPPTNPPSGSGGGNSGFLGLSTLEWLGILAIIAGVAIIAVVALWGRKRKKPAAAGAAAAAPAVVSPPKLPEPAPAPTGPPPAPWDEGPDET